MPQAHRTAALPPWLELAAIGGLVAVYLASFELASPVNQREVFSQDSVHILDALAAERPYGWNPQHHLLYHTLVDAGFALWREALGPGRESAFRFLKLFSAATGLAFLLCLRALLRELGLDAARRALLLVLAGLSVAAWFHFAGFETHGLALPLLALYALAVHRACRGPRAAADRALLAGALAACAWARVELFALAPATAALALHPGLRGARRALWVDAGCGALAGALGTLALAAAYLDVSPAQAPGRVLARVERPELAASQAANLRPRFLLRTARAFAVYPVLAPAPAERVPTTHPFVSDEADPERGVYPCHFCTPLRSAAGHPLALAAVGGWLLLLGQSALRLARRARHGEAYPAALGLAWLAGWLFYTAFNPREPFLWTGEFLVPLVAAVALAQRDDGWRRWRWLALLAALVALHNYAFFYRGPAGSAGL